MLGGVELTGLFAGTGGELADEVFVGIAQGVVVGGEVGEALGDFGDDGAEPGVAFGVAFAEFFGGEVDFGEEALEGAGEGFGFDVFEAGLEGAQQFFILGAGHFGDSAPEVAGLDDVVDFAAHLFFKGGNVFRVVVIPELEWGEGGCGRDFRVIRAKLAAGGGFVVIGEVAEEEEGEHVVAEVVGVHSAAQLVGDAPQGGA